MEEKTINEKESLELISQMIRNTKTNLGKGSGNAFLIWGYSCILASVVVLILGAGFHIQHSGLAYFLIPVFGIAATLVLKHKNKKVESGHATTYIEKSVKTLYRCAGSAMFMYMALCFILYYGHAEVWKGMFFLGLFVPAFCTYVAGSLLQKERIMDWSSAGLLFSCQILGDMLVSDNVMIRMVIVGIVSWTFSLVIPGHILNKEAKKLSKDERA